VLDRHVSTQCVYYETYSCACSQTKRRVSVHFLTCEVMPMRNFKHITPCLSQVQSKQSTTSQLFNLRTLLTMQLLTYNDVFVCNVSHMRMCLLATCHKISNVLSRPPCFHALCRLRDVFYISIKMRSKKRSPRIFDCVWPGNAYRHLLGAQDRRSPAFPLTLITGQ